MTNLHKLRIEKKIRQTELAAMLQVSQPTVSAWEKGQKVPAGQHMLLLAKLFDTTIESLLAPEGTPTCSLSDRPATTEEKSVPAENAEASSPKEAAPLQTIYTISDLPDNIPMGEEFFLRVFDSSNKPRFLENDIGLFRRQERVEFGQYALLSIHGKPYLRLVTYEQNGMMLSAHSPMVKKEYYGPEDIKRLDIRIIARLLEIRIQL